MTRDTSETDSSFSASLLAEHEWLTLGAVEKAESIRLLTADLGIRSVLEVGSGTGAVLQRLDALGYGERYFALEPSAPLLDFMLREGRPSRLVDAEAATMEHSRFRGQRFDLAILSHVLEHLDDPARLLASVMDVAEYVVVEVPLDGNLSGNVRAAIKTRLTRRPRHDNAAGHIQFYSSRDVGRLVHWNGGEIIGSRLYRPPQELNQPHLQPLRKRAYLQATRALSGVVGADRWARIYHGHLAVLIRSRAATPEAERTLWTPLYFQDDAATAS